MSSALKTALERIIRFETLKVTFADGETVIFGDGTGEPLAVRLTDPGAAKAIARDPALKLGEMYMDGRFIIEEGDIYRLLSFLKRNGLRRGATMSTRLIMSARVLAARLSRLLPIDHARRNVAHHYDLEAGLYDLFLDDDRQYSCAYFKTGNESLDEAQLSKKRHIAAKLRTKRGGKVLDIGCGWGGMAIYLAKTTGADVTGITLSKVQLEKARARIAANGLSDRLRFELQDYRDVTGSFDNIVSVGMFEHVGPRNYRTFFKKCEKLLDKKGVMVLHSIGRTKPTGLNTPWIEKYIFPGGYIPALSEVLPHAEKAGFLIKDVEILPIHYARTLRHWRQRFTARKDEVMALYDERFYRMWEFYLASSETAFRHERMFVFQLQLAKHQDMVPYTRDYIAEAEEALKKAERKL